MLADISLGDLFWTTIWIFFFMMWLYVIIVVFGDLFRDNELSGAAKVLWTIFIIFLPFLAVLIYLFTRGKGMAERQARQVQQAQAGMDSYIRETVGTSPAAEIAKAKELLDSGALTQAEFETLKQNALAAG